MLVLPAVTLLLPLFLACALLLRYSFDVSSAPGSGTASTWTFHNFQTVLGDSFYLGILGNTLRIGAIVTVIALILAYPLAYVIARSRWKKVLILLVVSSLWMDGLVRSYGCDSSVEPARARQRNACGPEASRSPRKTASDPHSGRAGAAA